MSKLTVKQEKFIDYYLQTGNAVEACKLAGYKGKNLKVIGSQNLTKLNHIIEKRRADLKSSRIMGIEDIQNFWTDVINDDEARLNDRIKASELLCKVHGGFVEKHEVKKIDTDWDI